MELSKINLTENDRYILESYRKTIIDLGEYLGSGFEIVLHSLEDLNHSVIEIYNGHLSGRKRGAPITALALSILRDIDKTGNKEARIYHNKTKSRGFLKSATIPIYGETQQAIGLLCVNFYMTTPVIDIFNSLMGSINSKILNFESLNSDNIEIFPSDIDDLLTHTINEVRSKVFNNSEISSTNKNKEIIETLDKLGIFQVKDSVVKVASLLNISKNTVYLHLRKN